MFGYNEQFFQVILLLLSDLFKATLYQKSYINIESNISTENSKDIKHFRLVIPNRGAANFWVCYSSQPDLR